MARYLLDTDAIIDHLVGIADSVALIQDLFDRDRDHYPMPGLVVLPLPRPKR